MDFFTVTVPAAQVPETRRALNALSTEIRRVLPQAAWVMVLPGHSLSILDAHQQALDLCDFPFELMEETVQFFGFGLYGLPGSDAPACMVRGVGPKR